MFFFKIDMVNAMAIGNLISLHSSVVFSGQDTWMTVVMIGIRAFVKAGKCGSIPSDSNDSSVAPSSMRASMIVLRLG